MPLPICPCCDRLATVLNQKRLSCDRLADQVRDTYGRQFVRIGEQVPINGDLIQRATEGEVFLPDTLRGQIAAVLELPTKDVFPEYAVECQRLREKRTARGWTQAHVAELAQKLGRGMRDRDISSLECGSRYAHSSTRALLAQVFELPEHELFPEFFA